MIKRKLVRLAIFVIPLILIFSQCIRFKSEDVRGAAYAGSAACVSCHENVYNSYLHTAHFLASQPASAKSIQGSFAEGKNKFIFNPHLLVMMQKRDSGFYQTSYVDGKTDQSQRFDISFGGVKGQSYIYWVTNELFQLPISYVNNTDSWINSPGYNSKGASFIRPVGIQCLDCHLSYAKPVPPKIPGFYSNNEGFGKNSLVYGIDCERCHGPAAEHVKFHTDNPGEKKPQHIIVISSLTRDQKINMCAICHSGANNHMLKPAFGYKPTDTLAKFMTLFSSNAPVNFKQIDVHGNQKGLLASSKCFINSSMDCSTCHNTHINERDKVLLYTARCMNCHNAGSEHQCKLTGRLGTALLANNCISCHMPAFPSRLIVTGSSGTLVHTHHIAIYPEETRKILTMINNRPTSKSVAQ